MFNSLENYGLIQGNSVKFLLNLNLFSNNMFIILKINNCC